MSQVKLYAMHMFGFGVTVMRGNGLVVDTSM